MERSRFVYWMWHLSTCELLKQMFCELFTTISQKSFNVVVQWLIVLPGGAARRSSQTVRLHSARCWSRCKIQTDQERGRRRYQDIGYGLVAPTLARQPLPVDVHTGTSPVRHPYQYTPVKTGKGTCSSLWTDPRQGYRASPAIWDHTVLPATRHRWMRPALAPAMQAGTRFTYHGGMEGWVDLVSRKRSRRESNSRPLGPKSNALTTEPPSNITSSYHYQTDCKNKCKYYWQTQL